MAKHLTNTVAIVNSCPHRLVSVRYATGLRRSKRKGKLPEFAKSFEQKMAGRVHWDMKCVSSEFPQQPFPLSKTHRHWIRQFILNQLPYHLFCICTYPGYLWLTVNSYPYSFRWGGGLNNIYSSAVDSCTCRLELQFHIPDYFPLKENAIQQDSRI